MDKLDLRSATKDTKHDIRKRAIRLIEKGVNKAEIARLLGVNRNSVNTWHRKYKADGSQGLHEKNRGVTKGSGSLLTATQARQIQDMITDKMPDQLKLPYGLWTRSSVKALIKREFGIDIAIRTMGTYLNSWGFTPQKPKNGLMSNVTKLCNNGCGWNIQRYSDKPNNKVLKFIGVMKPVLRMVVSMDEAMRHKAKPRSRLRQPNVCH